MTAEEAVSFVLKADLIGRHAEVYWLDMGEPVRVGDLAERFLACATPPGQSPVGIEVIGLRPGEKMREELTTQGQVMKSTAHACIWAARQRPVSVDAVAATLRALRRAVAAGAAGDALDALRAIVRDFTPSRAAAAAAGTAQTAPGGVKSVRLDDVRRAASA
jgi:FlaA1/EpsC-like NDP-sugar epimerase